MVFLCLASMLNTLNNYNLTNICTKKLAQRQSNRFTHERLDVQIVYFLRLQLKVKLAILNALKYTYLYLMP